MKTKGLSAISNSKSTFAWMIPPTFRESIIHSDLMWGKARTHPFSILVIFNYYDIYILAARSYLQIICSHNLWTRAGQEWHLQSNDLNKTTNCNISLKLTSISPKTLLKVYASCNFTRRASWWCSWQPPNMTPLRLLVTLHLHLILGTFSSSPYPWYILISTLSLVHFNLHHFLILKSSRFKYEQLHLQQQIEILR